RRRVAQIDDRAGCDTSKRYAYDFLVRIGRITELRWHVRLLHLRRCRAHDRAVRLDHANPVQRESPMLGCIGKLLLSVPIDGFRTQYLDDLPICRLFSPVGLDVQDSLPQQQTSRFLSKLSRLARK